MAHLDQSGWPNGVIIDRTAGSAGVVALRSDGYQPSVTDGNDVTVTWDARLRDEDVLDEIRLTSDLIIAATQADEPMTQRDVDRVLGLTGSA